MNEEIFCVPYNKVEDIKNGFNIDNISTKAIWNMFDGTGKYIDKNYVLEHNALQRILPFIIINNGSTTDFKILCNILKDDEKTIISIGFSEDITPDCGYINSLFYGCSKIILDNFSGHEIKPLMYLGTVRDTRNNPSSVGFVFNYIVNEDISYRNYYILKDNTKLLNKDFKKKYKDQVKKKIYAEWMSLDQLLNKYAYLTEWSKYCINNFIKD